MGFTGAHVLYTFDVFILALYLLFHGCALLKYTCKHLLSGLLFIRLPSDVSHHSLCLNGLMTRFILVSIIKRVSKRVGHFNNRYCRRFTALGQIEILMPEIETNGSFWKSLRDYFNGYNLSLHKSLLGWSFSKTVHHHSCQELREGSRYQIGLIFGKSARGGHFQCKKLYCRFWEL